VANFLKSFTWHQKPEALKILPISKKKGEKFCLDAKKS
jgi:hypothetical protein